MHMHVPSARRSWAARLVPPVPPLTTVSPSSRTRRSSAARISGSCSSAAFSACCDAIVIPTSPPPAALASRTLSLPRTHSKLFNFLPRDDEKGLAWRTCSRPRRRVSTSCAAPAAGRTRVRRMRAYRAASEHVAACVSR